MKEDIFQEISYRAWKSYQDFRGDCKFTSWIGRITRCACIDTLRRASARIKTVAFDNVLFEITEELPYYEQPLPVMDSLSKIERQTIDLYIEGKSYKEIAEITGETANKIGVRMHRIRESLRKSITYVEQQT